MSRFKVGDRVSYDTSKHFPIGRADMRGVFLGTVQTVRRGDGLIGIEFDDDIHGHNLFDHPEGGCIPGHGWYLYDIDVDVIDDDVGCDTDIEINDDVSFY